MKSAKTKYCRTFFIANRSIASQLPIGFPVHNVSWHELTVSCGICHRDLPDNNTRGTVTSLIPNVITVESVSLCKDCLSLIHGIYRFRSDGSVEYTNQHGQWVRSQGRRVTWWTRLVERIKQLKPLWENLI